MNRFVSFFRKKKGDTVLLIAIILLSLLSFAVGYIVAQYQGRLPIKIQYLRLLFG